MTLQGVAVAGSANLDVVLFLQRFAAPGETVLGDRLEHVAGGKGLNQAIAAARTASCVFVACLGDDEAGEQLTTRLRGAGVDLSHVLRVADPTGRAFIQVTPDGENSIVVMPLANHALSPERVTAALDAVRPAVVLAQLEIPMGSVRAAADWATDHGARFLLNPSPAQPLPAALLAGCDPLVLNLAEASTLLDEPVAESAVAARRLLEVAPSAVVTAGARGAVVASRADGVMQVPGLAVHVVDTTGAGDEFAGSLAAALAAGHGLPEAARQANVAAARVVGLSRSLR